MTVTNDQTGVRVGTGFLFQCGLGATLVVSSNAVTIDNSVHFIGGTGVLTTLNFPTTPFPPIPAIIYLISSAGSTWTFAESNDDGDAGNLVGPFPPVTDGTVFTCVWDGTQWHVVYTQTDINPMMFGAKGDGVTDDHAAFQSAIDASSGGTHTSIIDTPDGYLLTSPLIVTKSFTSLLGTPRSRAKLNFDLTAYTGPHAKYGIIIGDDLIDPSDSITYQNNALRDLNIHVEGGTGVILLQRATVTSLDQLFIDGLDASLTYGIHVVGSDSEVNIERCFIGNTAATTAPDIGISVENGSHQCHVTNCFVLARTTPIQCFNSVGTWISRSTIGAWVTTATVHYGVRIRTDQAVPSWLTWLPADTASDIHILNNLFEPGDFAGATIYDIYVGDGTPSVHSVVGCVAQDNFFLGTSSATRYPFYIDNADQTTIRGARWSGTIQELVHVTENALNTVPDIPSPSTYNNSVVGAIINDLGTNTSTPGRFLSPVYDADTYSALGGGNTWTVEAGDVLNYQYSLYGTRMLVTGYLVDTVVGGTPTVLTIDIPSGRIAAVNTRVSARVANGGTVVPSCSATVAMFGLTILIQRGDGAAFTAGATDVQFQIEIEVTP